MMDEVFLDTNRIMKPLYRRLHAAWHEMRGECARTVPTAGWELARGLDFESPDSMLERRDALKARIAEGVNDMPGRVKLSILMQIWWADAWLQSDSPYEMRFLTREEQEKTLLLVSRIDSACFPSADPGELQNHRDAMIICETLSVGGKILLTSNMESVDELLVNRWVRENQSKYDLASSSVVHPVDDALLALMQEPHEEALMVDAALGAYWPDDEGASAESAHDAFSEAMSRLSAPSSHIRRSAQHIVNLFDRLPDPSERLRNVGLKLPDKTRRWEVLHPAHPSGKGGPAP